MENEKVDCVSMVVNNNGVFYVGIDKKTVEFLGIEKGDLVKFTIQDIKKKENNKE